MGARFRWMCRVAVAAMLAASLVGCSAATSSGTFTLSVDPSPSWSSLDIQLRGAQPGAHIVVRATAETDDRLWSSSATFTVSANGTIDLASARPQFARYTAADATGLFWSMIGSTERRGHSPAPDPATTWASSGASITLQATQNGRPIARRVIRRLGDDGFVFASPVRDAGFEGTFYDPRTGSRNRLPAVLVIASQSAEDPPAAVLAGQIAARGFAAVAFDPVGRASTRSAAQSDESALDSAVGWLSAQPGVDPDRIFVMGVGAPEQLALWAAAQDPGLFGVIGASGTTSRACDGSIRPSYARTLGVSAPCAPANADTDAADFIDVANIRGPVVLACGTADRVTGEACQWMSAVEPLRNGALRDRFITATGVGHTLTDIPYTPTGLTSAGRSQATQSARLEFWQAVIGTLSYSAQ